MNSIKNATFTRAVSCVLASRPQRKGMAKLLVSSNPILLSMNLTRTCGTFW